MNIKNFSLEKSIKNTKFNFVKNFKYFIIAPLCLFLIGIILISTVNFNKGLDFTGGTIVNVFVGEEFSFEIAQGKIQEVLITKDVEASVFQETELENEKYITVKYKNKEGFSPEQTEELNLQIVDELFEKFDYNKLDFQEVDYVKANQIDGSVGNEILINAFTAIVIASILITIYLFVRFGVTSGMSSLLCVFHDILIMMSFVLIIRLEINTTFVSALIACLSFSFINSIMFFDRIRKNVKNMTAKNTDIANISVKENLFNSVLISSTMLIVLLLFTIIGVNTIIPFTIPMMFAVLISFYSTNFLAPALWVFAYIPKRKIKTKLPEEGVI